MRIPLVGESYALAAVGAATQISLNCYPEVKDDPNEKAKGVSLLRGTPGAHLFATLTGSGGNIRGLWSGGGRLFVLSGTWLYEVGLGTYPATAGGGSIISSQNLGANDGLPAWIGGNGTQLGIVANGFFYISNGGAAYKARFQLNSVVTIVGAAVTWTSGDKFPVYAPTAPDPLPTVAYISGQPVAITFTSAIAATLGVAWPGSGSGTCNTILDVVFCIPGTVFTAGMEGLPIVINTVTYTVKKVLSPYVLTLTDKTAGQQTGVAWSAVMTNLSLSNAGGALVTAVTGAYLDGSFYVQRDTPSNQVNFSGVLDGTSWKGLDYFQKEGDPTAIQSIIADHELLYVLGVEESEVWQSDPNTGRPVRIPGMAARQGSAARWAPVSLAETIYFIGGSPRGGPVAYRLRGSVPERISTHAVEQSWALGAYAPGATPPDGTAFGYIDQGHQFWCVNFSVQGCWVYDVTASAQLGTPIWHQRKKWNGGSDITNFAAYRWWFHTYIPEWQSGGTHIVGDVGSSKLYELSSAFGDEDGADMSGYRALPYRWNGGKQIFFGRQDLEMSTGLSASATVEPVITRDYSDDRGHTFKNPQTAGIGKMGDFSRRVFWPAGGSSRGRVWRYWWVGQLPVTLIDLWSEDVDGIV